MARVISLTAPQIPTYSAVQDQKEVETPNFSEAIFCSTADGYHWVRKGPNANERGTLAECVSWLLAKELGVPVPATGAVLAHADDGRLWMSGYVPHSRTWQRGIAVKVTNRNDFARMLLLDVLVDNGDRHNRNLLLTPEVAGGVQMWAIDFDAGLGSLENWSGDPSVAPLEPAQRPNPCWLSELEWPQLERSLESANDDLQNLLLRRDRTFAIAEVALRVARGADPDPGTLDHLAGYLDWRGQAAHTMAQSYWKAVQAG